VRECLFECGLCTRLLSAFYPSAEPGFPVWHDPRTTGKLGILSGLSRIESAAPLGKLLLRNPRCQLRYGETASPSGWFRFLFVSMPRRVRDALRCTNSIISASKRRFGQRSVAQRQPRWHASAAKQVKQERLRSTRSGSKATFHVTESPLKSSISSLGKSTWNLTLSKARPKSASHR
jgi:hypothetical protein